MVQKKRAAAHMSRFNRDNTKQDLDADTDVPTAKLVDVPRATVLANAQAAKQYPDITISASSQTARLSQDLLYCLQEAKSAAKPHMWYM